MRNGRLALTVLLLVMFAFFATGCSGRFETADEEAAKAIPDLSGIWEAPVDFPAGGRPRFHVCGEPACGKLLGEPPLVHDVTVEEPQMLPWAEEQYKATREEGNEDPNAGGREDANPWFSACTPLGPSALMLADFIGFELSKARLANIVAAVSFEAMKQRGEDYAPSGGANWKGGADTFLNKGTNGRWRDVFSVRELALYDTACDRALSPDCRQWLETGGGMEGNERRMDSSADRR